MGIVANLNKNSNILAELEMYSTTGKRPFGLDSLSELDLIRILLQELDTGSDMDDQHYGSGYDDGYQEGYDEGHQEGYDIGYEEARDEYLEVGSES